MPITWGGTLNPRVRAVYRYGPVTKSNPFLTAVHSRSLTRARQRSVHSSTWPVWTGTVRYPFRYCASARCAFFTGRATEVQRRTSMHVRRYPVRPGRRRESVRPRALAEEWTCRRWMRHADGDAAMGGAAAAAPAPRPYEFLVLDGWSAAGRS